MIGILQFPNIDPVLFSLGNLQVRWYGLFYIIAFLIGYIFIKINLKIRKVKITAEQYDSMLFNTLLGVILGGRLGYVLFYNLSEYLQYPLKIFAVWEGGMSFHGGALGVLILGYLFVKRNRLSFYPLADATAPYAALGLGLGRIGNFINAELYGRVTNVPWAMIFPGSDGRPRHPSQLYQALLEGFLLYIILQVIYLRKVKEGFAFWSFIGLYGVFRFFIEFFREPDPQLGFIMLNLTMGQILCLAMIISALFGFYHIYKPQPAKLVKENQKKERAK